VRAVLAAALLLAGCSQGIDAQTKRLEKFAAGHQVGSAPDAYLVRYGMAGAERIALVYAMADDMAYCEELAEMMMARYPSIVYRCEYAN
jgi:hypothetical protein